MSAGAHDFSLVCDSFTVGAAIFLFFRSKTIASGICTFLGARHAMTPQYPDSRIPGVWMRGYYKGMAAKPAFSPTKSTRRASYLSLGIIASLPLKNAVFGSRLDLAANERLASSSLHTHSEGKISFSLTGCSISYCDSREKAKDTTNMDPLLARLVSLTLSLQCLC